MRLLRSPVRRVAGHQIIGMLPAGQGGDAVQPAVDMGPFGAVETEGLGVKQVTAAGEIGDGGTAVGDPVATGQMVIQHLIGGAQARLLKADHLFRALGRGQEVRQESADPA